MKPSALCFLKNHKGSDQIFSPLTKIQSFVPAVTFQKPANCTKLQN